ncbi:hypothetical protein M405DRAFT_805874 [Rhizopogon salebrosus TDB-379]|nr:hypothetical protein M405DRAFT_805874 [Rhizopogon salebrosus TDB-379]
MGKCQKSVKRRQFPITPAHSLEHFLLEGFTPFDVYAAPSRSRGRENIQLLRDFDEKLLTPHPCEYLRLEDERLVRLDGETEKWWKEKKSKQDVEMYAM